MGWIILAVVVVLLAIFVAYFNRIVTLDNRVGNALSQVDVQLRRRNDLIPNLVNTVKGYAAHESGVFERVAQARERMLAAGGVEEKAAASGALSQALRSVFAIAENHPQLRADANFRALQDQLTETEDKIAYARQFFNDTVLEFNTTVSTVPGVLFAGPMNKRPKPFFEAGEAAQQVPSVSF